MPKVVNPSSGEVIGEFPYDAQGMKDAQDLANQSGGVVEHSGDFDKNEYTNAAAAEQQQVSQDLGNERMDAAMNPTSPFGDSSQGMGQGPGMGGGY